VVRETPAILGAAFAQQRVDVVQPMRRNNRHPANPAKPGRVEPESQKMIVGAGLKLASTGFLC
jgi:hypothetical protein